MGRAQLAQGPPEEALHSGWPGLGAGPPRLPRACSGQALRALSALHALMPSVVGQARERHTDQSEAWGHPWDTGQRGHAWAGVSEPSMASALRFPHLWDGEGQMVLTGLMEDYMHELLWGC